MPCYRRRSPRLRRGSGTSSSSDRSRQQRRRRLGRRVLLLHYGCRHKLADRDRIGVYSRHPVEPVLRCYRRGLMHLHCSRDLREPMDPTGRNKARLRQAMFLSGGHQVRIRCHQRRRLQRRRIRRPFLLKFNLCLLGDHHVDTLLRLWQGSRSNRHIRNNKGKDDQALSLVPICRQGGHRSRLARCNRSQELRCKARIMANHSNMHSRCRRSNNSRYMPAAILPQEPNSMDHQDGCRKATNRRCSPILLKGTTNSSLVTQIGGHPIRNNSHIHKVASPLRKVLLVDTCCHRSRSSRRTLIDRHQEHRLDHSRHLLRLGGNQNILRRDILHLLQRRGCRLHHGRLLISSRHWRPRFDHVQSHCGKLIFGRTPTPSQRCSQDQMLSR